MGLHYTKLALTRFRLVRYWSFLTGMCPARALFSRHKPLSSLLRFPGNARVGVASVLGLAEHRARRDWHGSKAVHSVYISHRPGKENEHYITIQTNVVNQEFVLKIIEIEINSPVLETRFAVLNLAVCAIGLFAKHGL
jgi:hypothetical protein